MLADSVHGRPVVFLDGHACAPRSLHNMNENVEHLTSIQGWELDSLEKRLRDDCADVRLLLCIMCSKCNITYASFVASIAGLCTIYSKCNFMYASFVASL